MSCFLASYFEDLISGSDIWNCFVRCHTELYNKPLPFYDIYDYYEDEINLQDVCFLIWYFLNTAQKDEFISPFNSFIYKTAEEVYDVFDSAWDNAPQNTVLKNYYTIEGKETDFYKARILIENILFKTYLYHPDTALDLMDDELEIIDDNNDNDRLVSLLSDNRDNTIHKVHTRLLNFTGKEWASKLLGENHPLHKDYMDMSPKIVGYFLYKGQDGKDIFIEHIASGRKFNLTKKSFEQPELLKKIDTIVFMGIVRWRSEWWFSGVYVQNEHDPELVLYEKNSVESLMAVDFLSHQENNVDQVLQNQFEAFMDYTSGNQIVFFESEMIDDFINGYSNHYLVFHKLSKKQKDKARQQAKADKSFGNKKEVHNFSDISDSGLIFFNPRSGLEVALAVNSAFPLPNNPFFNKDKSEEHFMTLLMNRICQKNWPFIA